MRSRTQKHGGLIMQAYLVNPVGFWYIALLLKSNVFFWSRNTAGKFCEAEMTDYIQTDLRKYVGKASFQEGFYKTIRKFNALEHLKRYVLTQQNNHSRNWQTRCWFWDQNSGRLSHPLNTPLTKQPICRLIT